MSLTEKLLATASVVSAMALYAAASYAQQTDIAIPCPSDEPCQVLVLTRTEVNVLTADQGILATAAQARNLDLGQYVAYFRQKIALAPVGKNQPKDAAKLPIEAPKLPEEPKKQP